MLEKFKKAKLYDAGGDLSQRWYVYFSYLHPETGKYKRFIKAISQKILTAHGRREKAHNEIKEINKRLLDGYNPFSTIEKRFLSISKALDFVQGLKENSVRQRTAGTYRHHIKTFKMWLQYKNLEHIPIEDFSRNNAQAFLDWTKITLKHSNRTYNNRITAMVTLFNVLLEREFITVNPFLKCTRLPKTEAEITSFTPYELEIMVKHLPSWNYDLYVCACLIFYCFIRPQELARMKAENIQLSRNIIILNGEISKNKKTEIVHIPVALRPILYKFNLNVPGHYYLFGKNQKRSLKYYPPTRIAESWRKFAEAFGINKKIYSLKHTGVGMAIENDINIRDLQLQIRHHSLELTQVYLEKFNRQPSEKLSRNFPDIDKMYGGK